MRDEFFTDDLKKLADEKVVVKLLGHWIIEIPEMVAFFNTRTIEEIKAFIRSHHGTSSTNYFLNKYLNDGGDPSQTAPFYYHGQKPVTKEQVILMVCDSIEAASRTLREFTPEACDRFVEGIVAGKEKAGQLEDADITLRDLNIMKRMLKTHLQQMYHNRVAYPKRNG